MFATEVTTPINDDGKKKKVPEKLRLLEDSFAGGLVSENEYLQRKKEVLDSIDRDKARKAFKQFDTDNNGSIDSKELQGLVFDLGEVMTEAQIKELLSELDEDGNGTVSFDEFYSWWSAPDREGESGQGERVRLLKLKLKSKAYVRDAIKASQKLGEAAKAVKLMHLDDPENLGFDIEVSVGDVGENTTIDVSFQLEVNEGAAKDLANALSVEAKNFLTCDFLCLDESTPEQRKNFIDFLVETINMSEVRDDPEFPLVDIKCISREVGGKHVISFVAGLSEDFSETVDVILPIFGLSSVFSSFRMNDTASSFIFAAVLSRKVTELSELLPADVAPLLKFLDAYQNATFKLKLRSLDAMKEALGENGEMIGKVQDLKGLSKFGEQFIAEGMYGLYHALTTTIDSLSGITLCLGGTNIFKLVTKTPGLFKHFTVSDEFLESDETFGKHISVKDELKEGLPETISTGGGDEPYKLEKRFGMGGSCSKCDNFVFGWQYFRSPTDVLHLECAKNLIPFSLADFKGLVNPDNTPSDVNLAEKEVVGLYFSAHWCGPCRGFTPKLAEFYNELKEQGKSFEIVFVSSDEDEDAYKSYHAEMPWLALPFKNEWKERLDARFEVEGIPTLVLVKGDGTTITTEGRGYVSEHGAKGFPFTEERIAELKGAVDAEMAKRPQTITDKRHRHPLKLLPSVYGGSYGCDGCKSHGAGWAYHCNECQWDLHPDCAGKTEEWEAEQLQKKLKSLANGFRSLKVLATTMGLDEEQWAQAYAKASEEREEDEEHGGGGGGGGEPQCMQQ